MIEISAVLLCYRRPYHFPEILENLARFSEVREAIIYQNGPESPEMPDGDVPFLHRVIVASENQCTLGRFLAAQEARYETILTHDDDLMVKNLPELIEEYERHGRRKIVANLADDASSRHWNWWQANRPLHVELGFGSLFPRGWAASIDGWPYDRELLRRKADKIFTSIHPWTAIRAGSNAITRLYHNGRESGWDEHSLWLRRDHKQLTNDAVRLALEWKAKLARD